MAKLSVRDRTRCVKAQALIAPRVAHIEAMVGVAVGPDWVELVNAERRAEGRREYRPGASDERAALALFAHAPGVRERWPSAARAASQLGGLLNAAHHNDADRWQKGDADRAEDLVAQLVRFLEDHPRDALTCSWGIDIEIGSIPTGKRAVRIERKMETQGVPGEKVAAALDAAFAELSASDRDSTVALLAHATLGAAASRPQANGHLRVEVRESTESGDVLVVRATAKRSDATEPPMTVTARVDAGP